MKLPRTLRRPGAAVLFAALALVFLLSSRAPAGRLPGVIPSTQFTWTRAIDGGANASERYNSVVMDDDGNIIAGGTLIDSGGQQWFAVTKLDPTGTTILWQKTLSGNLIPDNECRSVTIAPSGNIAATGTLRNEASGLDLVVMLWDSNGTPLWSAPQIYPGEPSADDAGNAARFDSAGNVIVAGYSSNSDSGMDFLVAKFAGSDGTLVWNYTLDGGWADGEEAFSVTTVPGSGEAINPQDDVVAVGTLSGTQTFYAVKLDGNSPGPFTTELWTRYFQLDVETARSEAFSVAADSSGDLFVGGVYGTPDDTDFFLTKLFGGDGSDAWEAPIGVDGGVNGADGLSQLVVDSNDDVLATGQLTDDTGSLFAVLKFQGSDGTQLWQQTLTGTPGSGTNRGFSIATDGAGDAIASGTLSNGRGTAFVAAKWDLNGTQYWVRQATGSLGGGDSATAVAVDGDGNVAAVGTLLNTDTGADAGVGYVDQAPPVISGAFLNPTILPPSGGVSNLTAKIHDNIGVANVTARVFSPDDSNTTTTVPPTGGTAGPDDYSADLSFPPNTTSTDRVYQVRLETYDATGNFAEPLIVGTVTVSGDTTAPALSGAGVSPRSLPPAGGNVALSVKATDDGVLSSVVAKITLPDTTEMSIPLSSEGSIYSGTYAAPANTGPTDLVYGVRFVGTDAATNSTTLDAGSFTVRARDITPPVISNVSLQPTELSQGGGSVKVSATVTDNVAVGTVTASVTSGGSPVTSATLTLQSGNSYAGTFDLPANFTGADALYDVSLTATDTSTNPAMASGGTVRVIADTQLPTISNASVTPRTLSYSGGSVTVKADVGDDVGVAGVSARISLPGGGTQSIALNLVPPAGAGARAPGTSTYAATYQVPANSSPGPQSYGVAIVATDTSGNQQFQDVGSFTVNPRDTTAPVITNQKVSPTTLAPSGGAVTIAADVTDNVAVGTVSAQITGPGSSVTTLPMTLVSGSTYQVVFNAPANVGAQDLTYTVQIQATDSSTNFAAASAGSFTVEANDTTPPTITNVVLDPAALPIGGGTVTISANVTDNRTVATVIARLSRPDGSHVDVPLSLLASTTVFRGTFAAPANATQAAQRYPVVIIATDAARNTANADGGTITVSGPATDTTPPTLNACDVSPSSLTYRGGPVQLTVTVTDDVQVAAVTARITGPDGNFSDVNLSLVSGNVYQGAYIAPPNSSPNARSYAIQYRAVDSSGNSAALSCGSFTVGVDTDAPTFANTSVAPQSLPGAGGPIVISADVTDPSGVSAVLGVVVYPDGSVHTVTLHHLSGATFQGTFNIPANSTAEEQVFTVGVSARDSLGNTGSQFIAGVTEGVVASGKLAVSTDHLDFGKVKFGTRVHGHITLRNVSQSGQPLIVTVDPLFNPFGVSSTASVTAPARAGHAEGLPGPFTLTLFPGQSQVLDVSFGPRITRAYTDRLQIQSTDSKKSSVPVRVKGIGCRNGRPGTPIGSDGGNP